MGRHWKALCAATGLWTVSVVFAICGTCMDEIRVMFWSLLFAVAASMVTAWTIVLIAARLAVAEERVRLEHLAQIMADFATDRGITKLK